MTGLGTKTAALAAMLLGIAASGMIAGGTAAAGQAGYAHAGTYGQVSGAKIHITLGAAPLVFGTSRRHRHRGHHGHHGHHRPVHGPVRGHDIVSHGPGTYGGGTYGPGTYGGRTHGLAPRGAYGGRRGGVHGGCRPTSKIAFVGHGRRAKVGGLMCRDRHGRAFVLPGSRHVLFYY